eukprot:5221648-Prymnesium_polylepis.2
MVWARRSLEAATARQYAQGRLGFTKPSSHAALEANARSGLVEQGTPSFRGAVSADFRDGEWCRACSRRRSTATEAKQRKGLACSPNTKSPKSEVQVQLHGRCSSTGVILFVLKRSPESIAHWTSPLGNGTQTGAGGRVGEMEAFWPFSALAT